MYFQLLHGIHLEKGKKYQVTFTRDEKTNEVIDTHQPIVESDRDLVELFGKNKFHKLTAEQAQKLALLADDETPVEPVPTEPAPGASAKTEGAKATEEGAKTITPPLGKDVTERFPKAAGVGMKVFAKDRKYTVVDGDTGIVLSVDGPLQRTEVTRFIKQYLEA